MGSSASNCQNFSVIQITQTTLLLRLPASRNYIISKIMSWWNTLLHLLWNHYFHPILNDKTSSLFWMFSKKPSRKVCCSVDQIKYVPHYKTTADFLSIIIDWWHVVNVKTVYKGIWHRNSLENPMMIENEPYMYLRRFSNWLQRWKKMGNRNGLTNETFCAIMHTTEALCEICKFCINNLNFSYLLPGCLDLST